MGSVEGNDGVVERRLDVGVAVGDVLRILRRGLRALPEREVFAAAISGSVPSCRGKLPPRGCALLGLTWPSSCLQRCAWGPCGCARWSWCAGRARAGDGGDADPGSCRFQPCGEYRLQPRGEDHLNLVVAFDEVTKCHELLVGQVLDAGVRVDAGSSEGFVCTGLAHAVDVSESNFHALFAGEYQLQRDVPYWLLLVVFQRSIASLPGLFLPGPRPLSPEVSEGASWALLRSGAYDNSALCWGSYEVSC